MDVAVHQALIKRFVKMAGQKDLHCEFPEQFNKHWENQGKSGVLQIFNTSVIDHPCELTFSLYFSGEEIIQTGVLVKFMDDAIVNEVQKGDALDFRASKRIDPIGFLRHLAAAFSGEAQVLVEESKSFTLAVDDDAESEVFRAVEHLTGMTGDELTLYWSSLLQNNSTRLGKDQVSPIIKTWLKKQRDLLDMSFLTDVHLLEPREQEVSYYFGHDRGYVVASRRIAGHAIREKVDQVDPEWWGGMFFGYVNGRFVRIPHEQKDRLLILQSFNSSFEFPIEEIFVDGRHVYSVIFVGEEALVWRTREQVSLESLGIAAAPPPEQPGPRKIDKLMARLKGKPAAAVVEEPAAQSAPAPRQAPKVHPYMLARTEKGYMDALRDRLPELNDSRSQYMKMLFDSDEWRFRHKEEELRGEMAAAANKALGGDAGAIKREEALLAAHVTIFFSELQAQA